MKTRIKYSINLITFKKGSVSFCGKFPDKKEIEEKILNRGEIHKVRYFNNSSSKDLYISGEKFEELGKPSKLLRTITLESVN